MLAFMVVFTWALFFLLTPGVLLSIPVGSSTKVRAAVHGLLFAVIYGFTHKIAWGYFYN